MRSISTQSSHFSVESKDSKVDSLETSHAQGMAFRILKHGRIGFSYTTSSNPSPSDRSVTVGTTVMPVLESKNDFRDTLEQMIEDAVTSSEATSPDPCFDFAPPLQEPILQLPIFDETLEKVSEKGKIEKAKLVERAAQLVDPLRIKKVRKASYEEVVSQTTLINSNGLSLSYASTLVSVSVTAVAEGSGESEMGWDFDYSHFIHDLDVEKVGTGSRKEGIGTVGREENPYGSLSGHSSKSGSLGISIPLSPFLLSRTGPKRKIAFEREERREILCPLSFPLR